MFGRSLQPVNLYCWLIVNFIYILHPPLVNRFVTRPDVKKEQLAEFLDWCLMRMEKANGLYLDAKL